MVMIRKNDKAHKVAQSVLKKRAVAVSGTTKMQKKKLQGPYLQH
jgi:hypothetical protein